MSAVAWRACAQVERVQFNAAGQVALELKSSWRDGATHLA